MLPNDEAKRIPALVIFSKKTKMKKNTHKLIIGLLLLPFAISLFVIDRFILVFLPHLESQNMKKWFDNTQSMIMSLIRTSVVGVCFLLWQLIKMKING